jgi:hypothetical protein
VITSEDVEMIIGGQEYRQAVRTFRHALEDAHELLSLEDINEAISMANEMFAEMHTPCAACAAAAKLEAEAAPTQNNVIDIEAWKKEN